ATARAVAAAARSAFVALDLAGLARVDFLLSAGSGDLYISEVNTMPGFTPISMYPKLWSESGLPYPELLNRLIELGLERADERRQLRNA
ncbi:MAG: D-alanine--D-alanine ligase A, partial [Chloroflexota bacterium]|nr:D-alanine--D-alanine ligase A [Chloroflexota bacterium]